MIESIIVLSNCICERLGVHDMTRFWIMGLITKILPALAIFLVAGSCWESRDSPGENDKKVQQMMLNSCQFTYNCAEVVPPLLVKAKGRGSCSLYKRTLIIGVGADNLSSTVTGVHLHHAPKGKNGPVVFDLSKNNTSLEVKGTSVSILSDWEPSSSQLKALKAGEIYVDFHTTAHPDGEVRAQIPVAPGW